MNLLKKIKLQGQVISAEHRQIAQSAFWVALFVMFAKIISAGKEMAFAWRYGVGEIVDAYQLSSAFMFWLPGTLGAAVMVVLIPILVSSKSNASEHNEFLEECQALLLVIGCISSLCALLFLEIWLPVIADNLSVRALSYTHDFSYGFAAPAVLSLFIALHSARLMAIHQQWNALLEGVPALLILLFVLLCPDDWMVAPLLWGTLVGYVFQFLILRMVANYKAGGKLGFRFSLKSPYWLASRNMISMMLLGQFLLSWVSPIDMATAAHLGDGAIAQLGYAERLLSLFLGLGAMAISRAILPVFSEIAARNDWKRLLDMAIGWGLLMFIGGVIVVVLAWLFAPWGVHLLYERGAFSSVDSVEVVNVFRWGLTRIPFYFSGLVFFQVLASQRMFGWIALIAFLCAASKYSLNEFFVTILGVSGINLATGFMYAFSTCCLFLAGVWVLKRRID